MLSFASLFAGIGGFDLAFERAGMIPTWQVEIDKPASSILSRQFPGVPNYHDVTEVKGNAVTAVDLICGGFPCQDVSVAGKRAGLAGKRTGLFFEAARIIEEVRPEWVVLENVPGLLSSNSGRDMGTVLGTLGDLGYGYAYRVLDAQYFGLAQRRRRVFIVGHLGGWAGPAAVLLEPEGVYRNPAPSREAGARITGTLAASSGSGSLGGVGQSASAITSRIVEDITGTLSGGAHPGGLNGQDAYNGFAIPVSVTGSRTHAEGADASEDGTGRGTPIVAIAENGRSEIRYMDIAPALSTGGGKPGLSYSATFDGLAVRRLTPRECERLQGFPDDWTAGQSDAQRYRQLGNAVAVPVVEWIGRRIVAVDTALRHMEDRAIA